MADTKSTSTVGSVRPFKVNYSHVKSDVLKTAQTLIRAASVSEARALAEVKLRAEGLEEIRVGKVVEY